jgi:hypothetical protein
MKLALSFAALISPHKSLSSAFSRANSDYFLCHSLAASEASIAIGGRRLLGGLPIDLCREPMFGTILERLRRETASIVKRSISL